jgi:phasin family protein
LTQRKAATIFRHVAAHNKRAGIAVIDSVDARGAHPAELARYPANSRRTARPGDRIMSTKKSDSAKLAFDGVEAVAAKQKETIEAAVKAGTEAMGKGYEQAYSATKEQIEKANEMAFKNYDEFADFGKETYEAVVASSNIFAKGAEVIGKEVAAFAQASVESNMAIANKLFTAKNPQELLDLQGKWAKESFDTLLSETTKLQDMSVKVATETTAPINARVNAAVEKMAKPIAA